MMYKFFLFLFFLFPTVALSQQNTEVCYVFSGTQQTSESHREWKVVHYNDYGWVKVPVIDGLVPQRRVCNLCNGGVRVVYDYTQQIPLKTVLHQDVYKNPPITESLPIPEYEKERELPKQPKNLLEAPSNVPDLNGRLTPDYEKKE